MLVFIDDSGDPGFKLEGGSSRYFVISCVIFTDSLEAEKAAVAIKQLRRDLGFPDEVEFKFSKSSQSVRSSFLQVLTPFDYSVRSLVIDKTIIRSDELRNNKNSFYSYAIKQVLSHSNNQIINAKIKIDGGGDRSFRKSFLTYLRKQLNSNDKKIMKNCKLVDSKSNVLIQMADMVAGSVRRSHLEDKKDADFYKNIIENKIQDEWFFK